MIDPPRQLPFQSGKLSFLPTHLLDAAQQLVAVHECHTPGAPLEADGWLKRAGQVLGHLDPDRSPGPGPLGTATLLEDAAAAALNAVRFSTDGNDENRRLVLLAQALLRAEAPYWARCVVDLLAQQGADIPPECLAIKPPSPTRMLDALNEPAQAVGFGHWSVQCDTGLTCRAVTFSNAAVTPAALLLTRPAGPGAAPRLQIMLGGTGHSMAHGQLRMGGPLAEPVCLDLDPWLHEGRPGMTIPADHTDAVIAWLTADRDLVLDLQTGAGEVRFCGGGAADALRHIDATQGRIGSRKALVARGRKTERRMPLAPALRQVPVPAVSIRDCPGAIAQDVWAFWRYTCAEASMMERLAHGPVAARHAIVINPDTEIWILPGRSGSRCMQYQLLYRRDDQLQSLTLPYQHKGVEPETRLLDNPTLFHGTISLKGAVPMPTLPKRLFLVEDDRGSVADQGTRTTWAWNGRWFERVLVERICSKGGLTIALPVWRDALISD